MPNCHILLTIFLIGMSISSKAQTYYSSIHDIENHSTEVGFDIIEYQGRTFVAMGARCDSFTVNCSVVSEIDNQGEILWSRRIPFMEIFSQNPLLVQDDTLYVGGFHVRNDDLFFKKNYLLKLNLDGDSLGVVEYFPEGEVENMVPYGIAGIEPDGSLLTYGEVVSLVDEEIIAFFMKTDATGTLDTLLLFNEGDIFNRMKDCRKDASGNIWLMNEVREWFVAGGGTFRRRRLVIYKMDADFKIVKSFTTHKLSSSGFMGLGIEPTADGGLAMICEEEWSADKPEVWKLNSEMQIEWKLELFTFPKPYPRLFDLKLTEDGDILVCGYIRGLSIIFDGANNFGYVGKISSEGELLWDRYFEYDPFLDYDMDGVFYKMHVLDDASILAVGTADRYFIQDDGTERKDVDVWVAKMDEDGCVYDDCAYVSDLYTSVDAPLEAELNVLIYPNPTNATITISGIDESVFENYSLFGALGNQVYFSTEFQQNLDLSHLSKGIYYLQIGLEEGRTSAQKIVVQ